jgi:hypothetical protein
MGKDLYSKITDNVEAPAMGAFTVTGSDTNELDIYSRAIYVGGSGDLSLVTLNDETVTFKAVPVGTLIPIRAKKILVTGTTATDLLGLY